MKMKSIDVTINRIIETKKIENTRFFVFRDIQSIDGNVISKIEGVALEDQINSTDGISKIDTKVEVQEDSEYYAFPMVIKNEDMEKVMAGKAHITDRIESPTFKTATSKDYQLILFQSATYNIFDLNLNPKAIPVHLDYINGQVDDAHYDLEKLLQILKNNSRVIDKENLSISDIPVYNQDVATRTIDLKVLLSDAEYAEYITKDYYDKYEYILNVLGADSCRK